MSVPLRISICHRCPMRERDFTPPACRCTVDGRDILEHVMAGDCPEGHYAGVIALPVPPPAKPDIPLAGDVVEAIAHRIGADRLAKLWERWTGKPCGCEERRLALNAATERLIKWLGK